MNKNTKLVEVGGEIQLATWNPEAEEWNYMDVEPLLRIAQQCADMTEQRNLLLEACKGLLDGEGNGFGQYSKAEVECARVAIARAERRAA